MRSELSSAIAEHCSYLWNLFDTAEEKKRSNTHPASWRQPSHARCATPSASGLLHPCHGVRLCMLDASNFQHGRTAADGAVRFEEEVGQLDAAVHNAVVVEVPDSDHELLEEVARKLLAESAVVCKHVGKRSIRCVLIYNAKVVAGQEDLQTVQGGAAIDGRSVKRGGGTAVKHFGSDSSTCVQSVKQNNHSYMARTLVSWGRNKGATHPLQAYDVRMVQLCMYGKGLLQVWCQRTVSNVYLHRDQHCELAPALRTST